MYSHKAMEATLCSKLETWSSNHTKWPCNYAIYNDNIRSLYEFAFIVTNNINLELLFCNIIAIQEKNKNFLLS